MGRGSAKRLGFDKGGSLGLLEPSSKAVDEHPMKAKAGAPLGGPWPVAEDGARPASLIRIASEYLKRINI